MKASQKDAIMTDFADGKIDVLVSTTVIEVGINVPNATLMIVENADRFGLSQLHQLRGRVGRGKKKAYCILVTDCKTSGLGENARRRLETMRTTYDGYKIAEEDLLIRGPGDFLPFSDDAQIRQSGGIAVADMCDDAELMNTAFEDASATLAADPTLKDMPELLEKVRRAYGLSAGIIN
jgi:ATP-dependent DNA helicase RecG